MFSHERTQSGCTVTTYLVANVNELISLNFNLEVVTKMTSRASALRQSKWRDCGLGEFIMGAEL